MINKLIISTNDKYEIDIKRAGGRNMLCCTLIETIGKKG